MQECEILKVGDKITDNQSEAIIIGEDTYCFRINSSSRGAHGIRTISKSILNEFVNYFREHPTSGLIEAKEKLSGMTDNDKFEYGYMSTFALLAKAVINKQKKESSENLSFKHLQKRIFNYQNVFYGAPGTGKSFYVNQLILSQSVIRTTFHPDSDYSSFVGAYKPVTINEPMITVVGTEARPVTNPDGSARTESKIIYKFVGQAFLQAYVKAWTFYTEIENAYEVKNQFLIIEEINRGNCAQIFGDLFQLLDRNDKGFSEYPIQADADMKLYLQEAFHNKNFKNNQLINSVFPNHKDICSEILNGNLLLLPNNLYIWATMNTSDQSLFPVDSAFKRRWDWNYVPIYNANKNWKICIDENYYDWWDFLEKINQIIASMTYSEDKKLGYFFCKPKFGIIDADTFVGKVIFYLWNDVFKDYNFDDPVFNDVDGTKLSFDKFYTTDDKGVTIVQKDKISQLMQNLGVLICDYEVFEVNNSHPQLKVIYNNETIKENTSIDTFIKTIEKVGIEKVAELNLTLSNGRYRLIYEGDIDPKTFDKGYGSGMRKIGNYSVLTKLQNEMKVKFIEEIAEQLELNLVAILE